MSEKTITRVRIHPAIGIARVGNSLEPDEKGYFVGPEVMRAEPADRQYKDPAGRLKRQAAQFRIYGYDDTGAVVREITGAEIVQWKVHLANKKAAWYRFDIALDLPEAGSQGTQSARRNSFLTGADRDGLIVDPGSRTISGANAKGVEFDTGKFLGTPVYLGELRTDPAGRLRVLGGRGAALTPFPGHSLTDFANNSGWIDDISDGPVSATVKIGHTTLQADPAWVVVAPPNYAPEIIAVQSMWDVVQDKMFNGFINRPARPSFTRDILPILQQFCDTQWVNFGFLVQFGFQSPYEFLRPDMLKRLSSADTRADLRELRLQIASMFRDPSSDVPQPDRWPPVRGDGAFTFPGSPREFMSLTGTRFGFLQQWVSGNFEADYDPAAPHPDSIEKVLLQDQPSTLDRVALSYCEGGPFHPGCEMTWPMRHSAIYRAPFRVHERPANLPEPDYGDVMTNQIALSPDGPLAFTGPGDLTRWMAVPWHTDTASCNGGNPGGPDQFLPTFWPGRVPNDVLTEEDYQFVVDASKDPDERTQRFNQRARWLRQLQSHRAFLPQIQNMQHIFDQLGIVKRRQGADGFPSEMFVESEVVNPVPHESHETTWTASDHFARARFRRHRK